MPSEVPSGWQQATVQEVVDRQRRVTYGIVQPGPRQKYGGTPIIRGQDYSGGEVDDSDLYMVSDEVAAKYHRSTVQGGDILLSIVGYLGLTAIVPDHLTGANLTQTTARIAINRANDHRFFHYQFQGPAFSMEVRRFAKGSAQPGLNLADVERMKVVVPPLAEQKKIAAILSSVDDAIQAKRAVIEQTRRVKEGLLQDLLTRGIGHTRFKQTEIEEIPETWEFRTVGSLCRVLRGASPRPKADPRYYGGSIGRLMVEDVSRDGKYVRPRVDSLTAEGAKKSRPMKAGSLVMVCSGVVGVPAILAVDCCIHDGFLGFADLKSCCKLEFLYYVFLLLKQKLDHAATHGGVFTNLTTSIIRDFPVPLPPLEEQAYIVDKLAEMDANLSSHTDTLGAQEAVKAGLLQDLLTGKVRVTV